MSKSDVFVRVPRDAARFLPAAIASGPAARINGARTNEADRQMAVGVVCVASPTVPIVALTLVLGDRQTTLTLDPSDMDALCHLLADATLWQNSQLRQRAGQAVH